MTTDSKAAPSMAEQVATALGRDDLISRKAAMEAIQSLRHAAAWNFTPAYSGSLGQARTDSFYEAYEAVRKMEPAALASTAGAGAGDWQPTDKVMEISRAKLYDIKRAWADHTALDEGDISFLLRMAGCHLREASAVPASPRSGAGEGEEAALGWLFHNPDTGTEWSSDHPVESGEVPDAEEIRPATLAALKDEMLSAWQGWEEEREAHALSARERNLFATEARNAALSQGGGAGRSERAVEIRELSEKATTGAPCHWGGGNDIIWCSTCGAQYAYAKGEERPPCPRSAAPAQSPSTSDREG